MIGLVTLIKENNYNKFNITFSIFAIIISIFSFIITAFSFIENNEDYKILNLFMFCICILIIIINISCLFLKHFEIKSTSYVVKVYNFENYLKKELEKINVGKNYLYYD